LEQDPFQLVIVIELKPALAEKEHQENETKKHDRDEQGRRGLRIHRSQESAEIAYRLHEAPAPCSVVRHIAWAKRAGILELSPSPTARRLISLPERCRQWPQ